MARRFVNANKDGLTVGNGVCASLPSGASVAVSMWAKLNTKVPASRMASWWCDPGPNTNCFLFCLDDTNGDQMRLVMNSGAINSFGTSHLNTGQWYHLLWAIGFVGRPGGIYVNGNSEAGGINNSGSLFNGLLAPFEIGMVDSANVSGPGGTPTADIAEVALWNIAPLPEQVIALARGVNPRRINPMNLLGYWPLWGQHWPLEPDMSGNGYNALPFKPFSATATQPGNQSFETPSIPDFQYQPAGATWTFGSGAGIAHQGGSFNVPGGLDGAQAAFIQDATVNSKFSQSVNFAVTGYYFLKFMVSDRNGQINNIQVDIDGAVLGKYGYNRNNEWQIVTTPATLLSAGNHTITFTGTSAGDFTTFIDKVQIYYADPAVGQDPLGVTGPPVNLYTAKNPKVATVPLGGVPIPANIRGNLQDLVGGFVN